MSQFLSDICVSSLYNKGLSTDAIVRKRLHYELKQIRIAEEEEYFVDLYERKIKFAFNEHNLLVAHLLDLAPGFCIEKESAYAQGEFPDIDVDYIPAVQKYIKDDWAPRTFGKNNVCSVGTYGALGIKSAILDMTRVYGVDKSDIQSITVKMEDKDDEGNPMEWDKALEMYADFKAFCDQNVEIAEAAKAMLERNKSAGVHAGGLIISDQPIDKFVPVEVRKVTKDNPEGVAVAAWTEGLKSQELQAVGLIKFDVLALINLQQIAIACKLIFQRYPEITKICALPGQSNWSDTSYLNDPKSIAMANAADLRCIFQFDSEGIRKLVQRGGVDRFGDLVAYSSLFRPSCLQLGMDARYTKRKKGEEDYFIHPLIEPIIGSTYGVMCIHQSALISMANGQEKPISQVKIGDLVHSVNLNTKRVEIKECHGCGPTRKENGYCLSLDNGYSVCLTHDHEVLTFYGMKRIDEIDVENDLIAAPAFLPSLNDHTSGLAPWLGEDENVAYLIGQLVGDGCLTSCGVTICVGSKTCGDLLKNWCSEYLPKIFIRLYFHTRSWYAYVSCPDLLDKSIYRKTKLNHFVDVLGLRTTSHHKRVPTSIMTALPSVRRSFLAGLMDSDGCLSSTSGTLICHITLDNLELLNDVRKLLAMDGIICAITSNGVRIHIWNTLKLKDLISSKLVMKEFNGHMTDGSTVGYVPRDVIRESWKTSGYSQRKFSKSVGISQSSLRERILFADSRTAIRCGVDLGDLRYYRIKSIEVMPNQQFYAMSVADNHNLIANGIVVKNCYQEQILQILHTVGNIPLIHCEKVRKAISKKKVKEFEKYKEMFLLNGQKNLQANLDFVEKMFDQVVAFSGYGFNRSHATAYTFISLRLLWLKAHYPLEFYTAILMCEKDTDKLKDFRVDAAAHNIDVRPVHINKSGENFRISDGKIYFGFSNIKHIGIEVAAEIVAGQPYNSFADFLNRFGTNAATIKALVSLGVFDEIEPTHDHLTLYKFYEYYKDVIDKRKARAKRYQQSLIKYEIAVKDLLLTEIKEDHPDFISMCKFDEEAINLWRMFVDVKREINYIHKGVEKIKEVSLEKQLHDIADKRQSSVKNFAQKEIDSDEEVITLNNFSSSKIKLDKELEEMLVNFATHKSHRYYPIAESAYYGFQWSSNVERSPLYKGYTIDVFLQKTEIEGELFSSIEVEIASCTKRSSKKGVEFYTVGVEDANGKNMMVNVWLDDYLRFKEELKKGTLVRMECKPPTGGFRTLTFNAPQKRFRSKLPNKEDDMRLMVLPQANEDPCVDLTGLVMNDN